MEEPPRGMEPLDMTAVQSASSSSGNVVDHSSMLMRRQLLLLRCLCQRLGETGERMENALQDTKEVNSRLQAQGEKPSSARRPLADLDGEIARTLAKMSDSRFRHLGMAPALSKLHSMLHSTVNQIRLEANCNNHSSEGSLDQDLLASMSAIAEELHDITELAERGERAADEVAQARHRLEVLAEDVSDATGQKPRIRHQVPVFPAHPRRERALPPAGENAEPQWRGHALASRQREASPREALAESTSSVQGRVRAALNEAVAAQRLASTVQAVAGEPIDVRIPNGDSCKGTFLQEDLHTTVRSIVGSMLEELAGAMDAERLKVLSDGQSNGMPEVIELAAAYEQSPSASLPSAAADRKPLDSREELFVSGLQDKVNNIEMQVKELGARVSSMAASSSKVHSNGDLGGMDRTMAAVDALTSANGDMDLGLHDVQGGVAELQEHMQGNLSIQDQVTEVEEFVLESSHWVTNATTSLLEQLRTTTTSFRSEHLRLTQQVTENESQIDHTRKEVDSLRHELSECMDLLKQDLTKVAVETVHKHAEKALDGKVDGLREDVLRDAHEVVHTELQRCSSRRATRSDEHLGDAADALHSVDKLRDEFCVLKNMARLTPADVQQIVAQQLDEFGQSDHHTAELLERFDHFQNELLGMKSQGRASQSDIQQLMLGAAEIEHKLEELQHQFLQLEDSIISGNAATTREGSLKEIDRLQEELSSLTKQGPMTEIEVAGNLRESVVKTSSQQDLMSLRKEVMEMIGPIVSERSVLGSSAGAAVLQAQAQAAKAAMHADYAALREELSELKERVAASRPVATAGSASAALRAAAAESAAARNDVEDLQQALSKLAEKAPESIDDPSAAGGLGLCNGTGGSAGVSAQDLAETINPLQEDLRLIRSQVQQLEGLVASGGRPEEKIAEANPGDVQAIVSPDGDREVTPSSSELLNDLNVLRDDVRKLEAVVRGHEAAVSGFSSTDVAAAMKEAMEESEAVKLDCESLSDSISCLSNPSMPTAQDAQPPVSEDQGNLQDDMGQLADRFTHGGGLITREEYSENIALLQERSATTEMVLKRMSSVFKKDCEALRGELARYATRRDCEALRGEIAAWSKESDTNKLRREQENINTRLQLLTTKLEENDDITEEMHRQLEEVQRYLEDNPSIAASASELQAKGGEDSSAAGVASTRQLDDRRREEGPPVEGGPRQEAEPQGPAVITSAQHCTRIEEIERRLTELAEANSEDLAAIHSSIEQVSAAVQEEGENVEWLGQELEKLKECKKDGEEAGQGNEQHLEIHHEKLKELSARHDSQHGSLAEQAAEISKKVDDFDMWARGEIAILQEGVDEVRAALPTPQVLVQLDHMKQAQAFDHTLVQDLREQVKKMQTSSPDAASSSPNSDTRESVADVTELTSRAAEIKELSARVERVEVTVQVADVADLRSRIAEMTELTERVEQLEIDLQAANVAELRSRVAEVQDLRERVGQSAVAQDADLTELRSRVGEVKELKDRVEQVEVTVQAADVAELRCRVAEVQQLRERVEQGAVAQDADVAELRSCVAEVKELKDRVEQVEGTVQAADVAELRCRVAEVRELRERVEQGEVAAQGAEVADLRSRVAEVTELKERVEQVEITLRAADVAELSSRVAEVSADVPELRSRVAEVKDLIQVELSLQAADVADVRGRVAEMKELREQVQQVELSVQAADVAELRSGVAEVKGLKERVEQVEVSVQAANVDELRSCVVEVKELKAQLQQVEVTSQGVEAAELRRRVAEVQELKERIEQVEVSAQGVDVAELRSGVTEVKELKERVEQVEVSVQDEAENNEWLHSELKNVNQKVSERLGELQGFVEQDIQDLKGRIRTLDDSVRDNGASNRDSDARIGELVRAIRQDQDAEQGAHQRLLICIDSLCERIQGVEGLVLAAANMATPAEGGANQQGNATVAQAAETSEVASTTPAAPAAQEAIEFAVLLERETGDFLGIQMHPTTLVVEDVKAEGLISHWNRLNPDQAVQTGDRVVEVNGRQQVKDAVAECQKSNRLHIVFTRNEERSASPSAAGTPSKVASVEESRSPFQDRQVRGAATFSSPVSSESPGSAGTPVPEKKEGSRRIRSRLRRSVNDFLGNQS